MSISQISDSVYCVDIPEVKNLSSKFYYSYYVNDEGLNDNQKISDNIMNYYSTDINDYLKYISDKVPRFVVLNFAKCEIKKTTKINRINEKYTFRKSSTGLISKNLDKILYEDHFSSSDFTSIQFSNSSLITDMKNIIEDSMINHFYLENYSSDISSYRKSQIYNEDTPSWIDFNLINKSISNIDSLPNVEFYSSNIKDGKSAKLQDTYIKNLTNINVNALINNNIVDQLITSKTSHKITIPFDLVDSLNKSSRSINKKEVTLKYISYKKHNAINDEIEDPEIVGYIIDKIEILLDGSVKLYNPIIIENPNMTSIVDFEIKYGSTYMYAIRSIAKVNLLVKDHEHILYNIETLISSNPSNRTYIECIETCAPQSPSDFNFRWDYGYERQNQSEGLGRLILNWTFPTNSQRDIKKFQVFRRSSINEPFLLLKEYDFNDNLKPLAKREDTSGLSEKLQSPKLWYSDLEFTKDSTFIYAVCCIDAHELSSGYSDQFMISFDKYKNKIVKTIVSHSGAPKQYPNLYLEGDSFIDSIIDEKHDRVSIYFNPEFIKLSDNSGNVKNVYETIQTKGEYKFQFISLTTQESEIFTLKIDNKIDDIEKLNDTKNKKIIMK